MHRTKFHDVYRYLFRFRIDPVPCNAIEEGSRAHGMLKLFSETLLFIEGEKKSGRIEDVGCIAREHLDLFLGHSYGGIYLFLFGRNFFHISCVYILLR